MNKIEITSATLKGRYSLDYAYKQVGDSETNNIKVSCDAPVHNDLRNAFAELVPHLAFICEEATEQEVINLITNGIPEFSEGEEVSPILMKYQVNSFKIAGDGDTVQLYGTKLLEIGETISIATPRIKLTENKYKFVPELSQAVEQCRVEVNEYLGGKHDPNRQTDMFEDLEGLDVESEEIEG